VSEELHERLQQSMSEGGFTQVDVAKATGLSQYVISRLLRGNAKNHPVDTLNRIRAFLGDDMHEDVLSHEDVRRAVRLFRYVQGVLGAGSQLIIREKDGTEKVIIPLW